MYGDQYDAPDDYDTPDIGRENYEACRDEEREMERDRYTVAEIKELEAEDKAEREARAEVENDKNIDYANDMKI